jgi:hypothetical protein
LKRLLPLVFLALLSIRSTARDAELDACPLPKNAKSTTELKVLPPAVVRLNPFLQPPGTDISEATPQRNERLLRALNLGRRWIIVTELAEIVLYENMTGYMVSQDGHYATILGKRRRAINSCKDLIGALKPPD